MDEKELSREERLAQEISKLKELRELTNELREKRNLLISELEKTTKYSVNNIPQFGGVLEFIEKHLATRRDELMELRGE